MPNYVFICTGNICRSAMAEGLARQLCDNDSHKTFTSMGVRAMVDSPADSKAIEVCKEIGVDISGHIARQLTIDELMDAEKIFCMDRGHLQFVSSLSPVLEDKCHLLLEYPKKKIFTKEVWDPYKMSLRKFRKNRDLINKQLKLIISSL